MPPETGERYTWQPGESLDELARPERLAQICSKAEAARNPNATLANIFASDEDGPDERACLICEL